MSVPKATMHSSRSLHAPCWHSGLQALLPPYSKATGTFQGPFRDGLEPQETLSSLQPYGG